jgi:hypothetical protein
MASDMDQTEKVKLAEAKMIAEREEFAKYLTPDSQHDLKIITTGICEFLSWFGFTDEVCYLKAAEFIKYKRNKDIGDLVKRFWGE